MYTDDIIALLILLSPFIIGGIIAAINNDAVNEKSENIEAWFSRKRLDNSQRGGWKYVVLNPIFYLITKLADWTDGLSHRGLKNGVRVAFTIVVALLWLGIVLYVGFAIVLIALALALSWFAIKKALSIESGPSSRNPSVGQRGKDIYEGDNWFNQKKVGRVDEDGNIYEGDNWLNEKKTGRIDNDGTVFEGNNWFSEKKTGRVEKSGDIVSGDNWLNEKKTGRIDDDGNIFEGDSWWNEKQTGKIE